MPGCGVLLNRLTGVLPCPPNTERQFPNAFCALAAEIANPASPQVVRVARANWKNARFMFDSFHVLHKVQAAAVGLIPWVQCDGCESRSPRQAKKTDVAEHPQVFDHVGLLANGLPESGRPLSSHPTNSSQAVTTLIISRRAEKSELRIASVPRLPAPRRFLSAFAAV